MEKWQVVNNAVKSFRRFLNFLLFDKASKRLNGNKKLKLLIGKKTHFVSVVSLFPLCEIMYF